MTTTTLDPAVVRRKMTSHEARRCADEIKLSIDSVGKKLLELYEGDGWQALGYSTWRECVKAEFGYSQSYAYRLLAHEEVNQNLLSFSPIGETPNLPTAEAQAGVRQRFLHFGATSVNPWCSCQAQKKRTLFWD